MSQFLFGNLSALFLFCSATKFSFVTDRNGFTATKCYFNSLSTWTQTARLWLYLDLGSVFLLATPELVESVYSSDQLAALSYLPGLKKHLMDAFLTKYLVLADQLIQYRLIVNSNVIFQNLVSIVELHHWPAFFPEWENIMQVVSHSRIFTGNGLCNLW